MPLLNLQLEHLSRESLPILRVTARLHRHFLMAKFPERVPTWRVMRRRASNLARSSAGEDFEASELVALISSSTPATAARREGAGVSGRCAGRTRAVRFAFDRLVDEDPFPAADHQ